jgi:hypothetical protein
MAYYLICTGGNNRRVTTGNRYEIKYYGFHDEWRIVDDEGNYMTPSPRGAWKLVLEENTLVKDLPTQLRRFQWQRPEESTSKNVKTENKEETPMSDTTKAPTVIKTVTYINGKDAESMSEYDFIDAIKAEEDYVATLDRKSLTNFLTVNRLQRECQERIDRLGKMMDDKFAEVK